MANSTGRPMAELKVCWTRRGPVDHARLTATGSAFDQAFQEPLKLDRRLVALAGSHPQSADRPAVTI
jgi:hypothetical protein